MVPLWTVTVVPVPSTGPLGAGEVSDGGHNCTSPSSIRSDLMNCPMMFKSPPANAASSCSLTSFASEAGYIFHCDCCMVPGIKTELADMPDIAALAIPRKLVVVHGLKDGLHSTATVNQAMARLKYIFSQHSIPDNFVFRWQPDGHRFYPSVFWPVLKTVLRPDR